MALLHKMFGKFDVKSPKVIMFTNAGDRGVTVLGTPPEGVKLKIWDVIDTHKISYHKGGPPAGVNSLFHNTSPECTWLIQGKGQWCWTFQRQADGNAIVEWVRGRARKSDAEPFGVWAICAMHDRVQLSGIDNFQFQSSLCCLESGVPKVLYMHLAEWPALVNKLDLFVASQVTSHMQLSLAAGMMHRLMALSFHVGGKEAGLGRGNLGIRDFQPAVGTGCGKRPTMVPLPSTMSPWTTGSSLSCSIRLGRQCTGGRMMKVKKVDVYGSPGAGSRYIRASAEPGRRPHRALIHFC